MLDFFQTPVERRQWERTAQRNVRNAAPDQHLF